MTDHTDQPVEPTESVQPAQPAPPAPEAGQAPEVVPEKHLVPEFVETPNAPRPRRPAPKRKSQPARPGERYTLVAAVSALRAVVLTFAAAVAVATILMWWTSPDFLPAQARRELAPVQATARVAAATPTALPTPIWFNRIGVLAGHSGWTASNGGRKAQLDPGAVCPDGFSEGAITQAVADKVISMLRGRGFTVDLLEEFDPRLPEYRAAAFVSLHADSCENVGYGGFKSSPPAERPTVASLDERLDTCVIENYGSLTGLPFRPDNITDNMRYYHAFRKIARTTPATILELGFLSYDRDLLANQQDKLALGIVNGLLCFLNPPPDTTPTPRP